MTTPSPNSSIRTRTENTFPVALITGGARRIGACIARTLHSRGYNIALHYNTSASEAESLATELNHVRRDSVTYLQADLRDRNSLDALAQQCLNWAGRCDLLVNNASSFYPTPFGEGSEQAWDDLFASNAKAPFFLSQSLKQSLADANGNIINIADVHAFKPLAHHTIYCMAKAANVMLTQSLALELAPDVRVNGIAPGAIMWPEDNEGNEVPNPDRLSNIPLKQVGGPQAIADTVVYLVEGAAYTTGQILKVDGGVSLK